MTRGSQLAGAGAVEAAAAGAAGQPVAGSPGFGPIPRLARIGPPLALWAVLLILLVLPIAAFLVQAFSPALFGTGPEWFTLANVAHALDSTTVVGLVDSLVVSTITAGIGVVVAGLLAWGVHRTDLPGRRVWPILVWVLLLIPSFLVAEGWEYLLQPGGVLSQFGIDTTAVFDLFYGPIGVVFVLTMTALPFAYLTISATLLNLGSEFEEAARVHGAGLLETARIMVPILAPGLLSAAAIVFAETMSDFGVASTLAAGAHFPIATYVLFNAIDNNPADFGLAAAVGWLLVATASLPIVAQAWALRGRTYAVVSGRRRIPARTRLRPVVRTLATAATVFLFAIALGAPVVGAIVASLLRDFGSSFSFEAVSLDSYHQVFDGSLGLADPLIFSTLLGIVTAIVTVVLGLGVARLLTSRSGGRIARITDLVLLGSVALPGIVLAAGYIFMYNLPGLTAIGLDLYETTPLLIMGYVATALPQQARLMVGPVSQLQESLVLAARVHGSSLVDAWGRTMVPVLSRVLLWGALLTFAKTLLELPVSQLLYPPGQRPVSVAINWYVTGLHYDTGTAMSVVALVEEFGVIVAALGLFRLLAPRGWRLGLGVG
ncbi:MAG TPA: ABC transporter permease subunit [Candidatus Saccharimonadales bacterium]|nr:ABC transporter permease subunit [Candidatus Saccharimonadales bacterium]